MPSPAERLRARWAWLLAVVLCLANLPLHKPISDLCDALFRRLGRFEYEYVTLLGITGLSVAAAWLLWRGGGRPKRGTVAPIVALTILSVAAQQLLLVSNVELIHFPQFGLLAALLLAGGMEPLAAWLVASAAGVLDEVYQHLVIYAGVPGTYLDFNDMVLNAIGAAWPIVLVSARAKPRALHAVSPSGRSAKWRAWIGLILLAALPFAFWLDPPVLHPFLVKALTGRLYRVLSVAEALVAVGVIWLIVLRAIHCGLRPQPKAQSQTSKTGSHIRTAEPRANLGLFLLAVAVGGCTTAPPVSLPTPEPAEPFLLTFWCGPPLERFDDAQAAAIAAAGFTVVGAPCEGDISPDLNRKALDIAQRHGLKMWIADRRIGQHFPRPDWKPLLLAGVADYRDQPALDGYFLIDEPTADRFDDLAPVVKALGAADPERLAYINLLPDFVSPKHLQADSYRDYVESFVRKVKPRLLSYDYYPFKKKGVNRPSYFENLGTIREIAQQHDLPFLLIVQAMPHGPYRDPSEAELSWQVFHGLAYGASGISYFAYWTPVDVQGARRLKFHYGLVEDGKPTLHYFQAQRLNRQIARLAGQLGGQRSLRIADSLGEIAPAADFGPLRGISGGPVTVGFFAGTSSDSLLALLVNRDYRYAVDAQLQLHAESALPSRFDTETGEWLALWSPILDLPPGGAVLLRWQNLPESLGGSVKRTNPLRAGESSGRSHEMAAGANSSAKAGSPDL